MLQRYFTRARLRADVPAAALRRILMPDDASARIAAGHRLVWTLFGDRRERSRDFLWREAGAGTYYLLSAHPPRDEHGLFFLDAPKAFAPRLEIGDRLHFALRVNATVSKSSARGTRGKPCDIVMNALAAVERGKRAARRRELMPRVAWAWMTRQGERAGFSLVPLSGDAERKGLCVRGYRVMRIDRERGNAPMRIGVLDLEGVLQVTDPMGFLERLVKGFGRAKAYGCGLMMIRRA